MKFVISQANWTSALADALTQAEDGDTISVDTLIRQELATRAARRMGKTVYIVVEKYRICWQNRFTGIEGRGEWLAFNPTALLVHLNANNGDVDHWIEQQP